MPSAEQPDPKSDVLLRRVFSAASATSAVSSITIVEFPAPTPYAGVPELYAALTMSRPPVACTRSAWLIRYCAAGMLGRSRHWRRSTGAPSRASARRMISTVSRVVRRLRGWGEKITASRHLSANIPTPGGVSSGFVVGTRDAMTPTGFAYFTIPRSGSSSMMPTLRWRSTSRRMPMTLNRLPTRLTGSPIPLSSTPIAASRVKVVLVRHGPRDRLAQPVDLGLGRALELAQGHAARATSSSTLAVSSGVIGLGAIGIMPCRVPHAVAGVPLSGSPVPRNGTSRPA